MKKDADFPASFFYACMAFAWLCGALLVGTLYRFRLFFRAVCNYDTNANIPGDSIHALSGCAVYTVWDVAACTYDTDTIISSASGHAFPIGCVARIVCDVPTYTYDTDMNIFAVSMHAFPVGYAVRTVCDVKNLSNATVSQYDYNYDNLGRRDRVDTTGQAFVGTPHNSYGYNPRSELEESKRFLGTADDPAQLVNAEYRKYVYDPIGNRTSATEGTSTSAKQLTYTANQLNQYTLITSPVEASPGYDADGNLTTAPAGIAGAADTLLKYDAENRLISVEPQAPAAGSTKVEYVYDYMSRRAAKKVFAYAGGSWSLQSTSTFIYDGWNLIKEVKTPESGSPAPVYYIWGLDLSGSLQGAGGIGGLLARVKDGAAQQYTFDGNGNVAQLISSTGAIVAQYEYDPYGNAIVATGDNPFRFSTKFFDDETGLLYYGYRHYSPVLGRWLNRDPIGEEGGFNLYGFVQNNPTTYSDLFGLALYAFDGTGTIYETRTNIAILYDSYRGSLKAYEEGVGSRWYNSIFGGIFGAGGNNRLKSMYKKLVSYYPRDDKIDIIGFSRGASLAREFANRIYEKGIVDDNGKVLACRPDIRFVGLFDTVGSFGIPGNSINIGIGMDLPPNVKYAAQAIARHERRSMFPLTPLNKPKPGQVFKQKVFNGDHSDIGGGHEKDNNLLSHAPLLYIWSHGLRAGVPFGSIDLEDRYKDDYTPHDLTKKLIYTDGGPRQNLPED